MVRRRVWSTRQTERLSAAFEDEPCVPDVESPVDSTPEGSVCVLPILPTLLLLLLLLFIPLSLAAGQYPGRTKNKIRNKEQPRKWQYVVAVHGNTKEANNNM